MRQLSSGRWQARYPHPDSGKLTPAPSTFATKADANRWLAKRRSEIDAGLATDDQHGDRPLSYYWDSYVRTWRDLAPSSRAAYEAAWRIRIQPRFGNVKVRRIRASQVDEFVSELIESGASRSLVAETTGVLKRILDRAVRDRALSVNPCDSRARLLPKRMQKERPVLSPAEVEQIVKGCKHERDKVLIRVLAYGGLRISEAFGLHWSEVDTSKGLVTVKQGVTSNTGPLLLRPTKTYATRHVDLPKQLVGQIVKYREGASSERVFPARNGNYLRYTSWRKHVWNPAIEAAGITALPHDLRSTAASLLIDAGASVADVSKHLGHSNVNITLAIYTRVRPNRSKDIADRLSTLMDEVQFEQDED